MLVHGQACMPDRFARHAAVRRDCRVSRLSPEGAEGRGSNSACALLDGLKACRVSQQARQCLGAESGHRQSLRTVCRLTKAIGLRPMAAQRH